MTGPGRETPTILIAEDEYITGTDIQNCLIDMGYDAPLVVDNGAEAIEKAGTLHPDVVLMDITLIGEISGIDAASVIRERYDIPVIFLTAHSDDATFEHARVTEPFGYLIKPFEPRSLHISIEMALYKHAIDERLRKSEERYRGFVQNFLGIAYRYNQDASLEFLHGATEAITGYPADAFMKKTINWNALVHPDDAHDVRALDAMIRESAEYSATRDYRIIHRTGEVRWIHERIQKIREDGRSPAFIQGACYDITDRKNAEDATAVASRKLNLLNNITRHDILNSLHGLLGLIEMARDTIRDESARPVLADMETAARQIQRQITFTRNYQDVGVKAPVWQGINDCIAQAKESISHEGISVIIDPDEDLEFFADPLLVKVFYNLIDNALRYGDTMTQIAFRASVRDTNLILTCEDDGIGIPAEEKERIFEQCVGKNTGMGLFLAREILMITGISIRECGMPKKGACFEMNVPPGSWRRRG